MEKNPNEETVQNSNEETIQNSNVKTEFLIHLKLMNDIIENPNLIIDQNSGITALMTACICNNIKMVEYLVHNKADVNLVSKNDETALILALDCYNTRKFISYEIVEMLLKFGADVNFYSKKLDTTPLIILMSNYNYTDNYSEKILDLLLKYKVNLNFQLPDSGATVLHILTFKNVKDDVNAKISNHIIKKLIMNGAKTDIVDSFGHNLFWLPS